MVYVTTRAIQQHYGISTIQLRRWADTGKIDSIRTPGGHRLYKMPESKEKEVARSDPEVVVYIRVSSGKQKDDLGRQRDYMLQQRPGSRVVQDVASGINWKRPGLLSILDDAMQGKIKEVVVYSRDRLSRFAFDIIEWMLNRNHCKVTVLQSADQSPEEELSDDLMSIVQVFCCKRNGRRRYKRTKNSLQDEEGETESNKGTKSTPKEV
jgi:predicted site-specific integrase-resolvase